MGSLEEMLTAALVPHPHPGPCIIIPRLEFRDFFFDVEAQQRADILNLGLRTVLMKRESGYFD